MSCRFSKDLRVTPPPADKFRVGTTISQGPFVLTILQRQGDVLLLEKTRPSTGFKGWEVAVLRIRKAREMPNGYRYPDVMALPAASEWGRFGWTCLDLESAEERFGERVRIEEGKKG